MQRDDNNDLIGDLQSLIGIASEENQLSPAEDRSEAIKLRPETLARLDGMLREGERREDLLSIAIEREFERRQHKRVPDEGITHSGASIAPLAAERTRSLPSYGKNLQSRTIRFAFACVAALSFLLSMAVVLGCLAFFFLYHFQEPFLGKINF